MSSISYKESIGIIPNSNNKFSTKVENNNDEDEKLNQYKMTNSLAEKTIINEWNRLVDAYNSLNDDEFMRECTILPSLFYDKSIDFSKMARSLGILEFIVEGVNHECDYRRLAEIMRLTVNLLATNDDTIFEYLNNNNVFHHINRMVESESVQLISCAISTISSILPDYVKINRTPPFDFSATKIAQAAEKLYINGPIFCLLGNILFELPSLANMNEYIKLGFDLYKPYDDADRFFDGLCYAYSKYPEKYFEILFPYIPYLSNMIFLENNSERNIQINSARSMKLLLTLLNPEKNKELKKRAKESILPYINLNSLLSIFSYVNQLTFCFSSKLISKLIKLHLSEKNLLFENPVFQNIISLFQDGLLYQRIGSLIFIYTLNKYYFDDERIYTFYEPEFIQLLTDFIDISSEEQSRYTIKLLYQLILKNRDLISLIEESAVYVLEEIKNKTENEKLIFQINHILSELNAE